MRLLVATDAWRPQINGVVRTYERMAEQLPGLGASIDFLGPGDFKTFPCPTYPQIALAAPDASRCARLIDTLAPDAIHIATEGPVGWMARAYCQRRGIAFTTSFHTMFPEYVQARWGVPRRLGYAILRRFHRPSSGMMVATRSLGQALGARGFRNVMTWTRGVDADVFQPRDVRCFGSGPVFLYAGRVAVEKNLEAFLLLDLPGHKVVVGDGPLLQSLRDRFPAAIFTGALTGSALAEAYASADVFVFPSVSDTFGIVMLEAMACGVPVAAFPVTGPIDVVRPGVSGVLSPDLRAAALGALALDRRAVRAAAQNYTWEATARLFLDNIEGALFRRRGRPVPSRQRAVFAG